MDNVVVVVLVVVIVGVVVVDVDVLVVEDFCVTWRVSVLFLGLGGGVMRMEGLRVPSS